MSSLFEKKELNSLAKKAVDSDKTSVIKNPQDAVQVICNYWPLLKKVIGIVKIFTNAKVDAALDKVLEAGELLCPPSPATAPKKSLKK